MKSTSDGLDDVPLPAPEDGPPVAPPLANDDVVVVANVLEVGACGAVPGVVTLPAG